jgi:hypothetical protein
VDLAGSGRDEAEYSGESSSLFVVTDVRVVPLHPLGDMARQRASDDGVHVRSTDEIGERVPHPVDREAPLDTRDLYATAPRRIRIVDPANLPQTGPHTVDGRNGRCASPSAR